MYPIFHPLYLYIKLHFLCIQAVRPCHIQEVISQHLFGISTKFFQHSKAHDLLSDYHLCQVAPKLQSRSLPDIYEFMSMLLISRNHILMTCMNLILLLSDSISNRLCSIPIPLAVRHGNTQTNKPLNCDNWGLSKLLSRRD